MKKQKLLTSFMCVVMATSAFAQTCVPNSKLVFDMTKEQPVYSPETGFGYDIVTPPTKKSTSPFYFSVKVPDGNYRVTVTLGSKAHTGETLVRAENRRLMADKCITKKGKYQTISFLVNKRSTEIPSYNDINGKSVAPSAVRIKKSEEGSLTWDEKLTLEFNGAAPCVQSISIEPDTTATTVFLCGNSTVVDQGMEPWASWGQMFPLWFPNLCIANYGESGLTATSFMAQKRLEKILSCIKEGDYVFCEFGHNDEKEKGPGTGAWYHYTVALKKFIDEVRARKANIIFSSPTCRRFFKKDHKTLRNTHGDFPAAMEAVTQRENVPFINLTAESTKLFEAMGEAGSKSLLVHYPMGTWEWQTKEFADNTHFNPFGAYEISKLIVMGLKQLQSPMIQYLRPDWLDFSPLQPDAPSDFYWPESPLHDGTKPDGN